MTPFNTLLRGQSDAGLGYQSKAEHRALCARTKEAMGTPFIVARQPSQSPLSLTGICYEVSDKLGGVETTVSPGEPQNELSVLLRSWRVCLLQQILHHSGQMNSLDGNTIARSAVVTRWRTELRVVLLRLHVQLFHSPGGRYLHPSSLLLCSRFCQDPWPP